MSVSFTTPLEGLLLAAVGVVPLAAFALAERRARAVRARLGLPEPPARFRVPRAAGIVLVAGLVGAAAAQPVIGLTSPRYERSDAEALFVLDTSRSMLARRSRGEPTRLERAKHAAMELRSALPGVPVGLASLTDRVLPHLPPSADEDAFAATVERALGVERPPPLAGRNVQVTNLAALSGVPALNYFMPSAKRRLVVVLTDAESVSFRLSDLANFRRRQIPTILVRFWHPAERVYRPDGEVDAAYRPEPGSRELAAGFAAATGGRAFSSTHVDRAVEAAREYIGSGPAVRRGEERGAFVLSPYLALAALLPLAGLLVRGNR